jgi:hypothetical protein
MRSALVLLSLTAVSVASASPLVVQGLSTGRGQNVTITTSFGGTTTSQYVWAGPLVATIAGAPSFEAYCVDLTRLVAPPETLDVVVRPIGELTSQIDGRAEGDNVGRLYSTFAPAVSSSASGAALQLAIWDQLYDSGDGLNVGLFQASGIDAETDGFYADYLAALTHGSASGDATWFDATAAGKQSFVAQPVPEPGTMAALGLGLAALARRRRAKRA